MDLRPKFIELESLLLEQRDLIGLHSGVPFILLVYPPDREKTCMGAKDNMADKIRSRGVPVFECKLSTFIFDYYKKQGYIERVFDLDRDPEQRETLRRMIAGVYERNLPEWVLEMANKAEPDGILFMTGVASLYPFARISNLLSELETKIKVPMVVFYPGRYMDGNLYFLNSDEAHVGYRARIL
jgi:hypothetical protein